jgi:hypothetical protein
MKANHPCASLTKSSLTIAISVKISEQAFEFKPIHKQHVGDFVQDFLFLRGALGSGFRELQQTLVNWLELGQEINIINPQHIIREGRVAVWTNTQSRQAKVLAEQDERDVEIQDGLQAARR